MMKVGQIKKFWLKFEIFDLPGFANDEIWPNQEILSHLEILSQFENSHQFFLWMMKVV